MKKVLGLCLLITVSMPALAQKSDKLTKDESRKMTQDQRVLHESDRKSKHGKKDLSMKKKVRLDKKQARKAKRLKQPKQPKRD